MTRQFKALSPLSRAAKPEQQNFETPVQSKSGEEVDRQTTTPEEIGGRGGLDPVRYGDWEVKGRCVDF